MFQHGTTIRFRRFRRSYENCTAVVPTTTVKVTLLFYLMYAFQSGGVSFFWSCLSPMMVHLRNLLLLNTHVARMLLTPSLVSKQKDVKQLSINISKLTLQVKPSISCRTPFFPNFILAEEETLECFAHSATLISWFSHFISKTGGFG